MAVEEIKISTIVEDGGSQKTLKDLRNEVKGYRDELINLERGTKEYNDTLKDLANAQGQINQINQDVRASTLNLTDVYSQVTNSVKGVVGGFGAIQSAAALLGSENEALAETFVKLQAAQTLLASLTAISGSFKSLGQVITRTTGITRTFNLTLLANPFVLVGAAIVVLIGYFTDLGKEFKFLTDAIDDVWQWFKKLLPSIGDTSTALDGLKAGIAGVGTAIIRLVTGPAKALIALLKGDLQGALDEIGKSFNVAANFVDGFTNSIQKASDVIGDTAERNVKHIIEENEAKYGSDFKYTEEGRKLYEEYFNDLLQMYDENSEDYRKALNQKYAYDRDYTNRIEADAKKAATEAARIAKQRQDELDKIAKEAADAEAKRLAQEEADATRLAEALDKLATRRLEVAQAAAKQATVDEARVGFIQQEINVNKALQAQYNAIINDPMSGIDARIEAINNLIDIEKQYLQLESELISTEEETANKRIEIEERLQAILNPESLTYEEQLERDLNAHNTEIARLWELANETTLSYDERIAALDAYDKAQEASLKTQYKIAQQEALILKQRQAAEQAKYAVSIDLLNGLSRAIGEQTAVGKAAAVAATTIDTYRSATGAYASLSSIPFAGPALGIAAAAAAIASGIANVRAILGTKVDGESSSNNTNLTSAQLPSMPEILNPITETHNNMDSYDEEFLNRSQQVYVTEYDISRTQNKVNVAEANATF